MIRRLATTSSGLRLMMETTMAPPNTATKRLLRWGPNVVGEVPSTKVTAFCSMEFGEVKVGSLDLVGRRCVAGVASFEALGIGGVWTDPAWRRRGVAAAMVREALSLHEELHGLLFTLDATLRYYASLGWARWEGPVTVQQPSGDAELPAGVSAMVFGPTLSTFLPLRIEGLPW